jgi:hypothetical protein
VIPRVLDIGIEVNYIYFSLAVQGYPAGIIKGVGHGKWSYRA